MNKQLVDEVSQSQILLD